MRYPRDAQRVAPLKRSGLRAFFKALLGLEGRGISDPWSEKGTSTERAYEGTLAEGATRCASRGSFFLLKKAHFYPCSLEVSSSLRIAWDLQRGMVAPRIIPPEEQKGMVPPALVHPVTQVTPPPAPPPTPAAVPSNNTPPQQAQPSQQDTNKGK